MVTLLRRYFSYHIINSYTLEAALELTIKITVDEEFLLLPIKNYTADLKITDSNNKELIILSNREFEARFKIPMSVMIDAYVEQLRGRLGSNYDELTENYRVIAVLLKSYKQENDREHESEKLVYYEKIRMSWLEKIEKQKTDGIIFKNAELPIYLARYGLGGSSGMYLAITTDPKYVILEEPKFQELQSENNVEPLVIHSDDKKKIYRFYDSSSPQVIMISVRIGLPLTIKRWAYLGLVAGTVIPLFLLIFSLIKLEILPFTYETLGGVIGLLIGQKFFIFEDLTFIDRWNRIHTGLTIFTALILMFLMFFVWADIIASADASVTQPNMTSEVTQQNTTSEVTSDK